MNNETFAAVAVALVLVFPIHAAQSSQRGSDLDNALESILNRFSTDKEHIEKWEGSAIKLLEQYVDDDAAQGKIYGMLSELHRRNEHRTTEKVIEFAVKALQRNVSVEAEVSLELNIATELEYQAQQALPNKPGPTHEMVLKAYANAFKTILEHLTTEEILKVPSIDAVTIISDPNSDAAREAEKRHQKQMQDNEFANLNNELLERRRFLVKKLVEMAGSGIVDKNNAILDRVLAQPALIEKATKAINLSR